jgi:hypothetical protein
VQLTPCERRFERAAGAGRSRKDKAAMYDTLYDTDQKSMLAESPSYCSQVITIQRLMRAPGLEPG